MDEVPVYFALEGVKATKSKPSKSGIIDIAIEGKATFETPDFVGQTVLMKGLDVTYLQNGKGRIKYEHKGELGLDDPQRNIGHLVEVIKSDKDCSFKARVFALPGTPQHKFASAVEGDLINIEAWNEKYPNNRKSLGVSIEGKGFVDGTKIPKMIATNIVLSSEPVHTDTYAQVCKSLATGTSVNPNTMTGGAAIRKESFSNNKKKGKKMFKKKEEAIAFYKSMGFTDVDADKKADEYFANKESLKKSLDAANEIIDSGLVRVEKSLGEIKGMDFQPIRKSLNDSLKKDSEGAVDLDVFFQKQADVSITTAETVQKSMCSIFETMQDILKSQKSIAEAQVRLEDNLDDISEVAELSNNRMEDISKSLRKELGSSSFNKTGEDKPNDKTEPPEDGSYTADQIKAINKSLTFIDVSGALMEGYSDKKLNYTDVSTCKSRLFSHDGVHIEKLKTLPPVVKSLLMANITCKEKIEKAIKTTEGA